MLECIMGQGNTKWYKQCILRIKWRMGGKTHLMELNCVVFLICESTDRRGIGTWLFTTSGNGKSGNYAPKYLAYASFQPIQLKNRRI